MNLTTRTSADGKALTIQIKGKFDFNLVQSFRQAYAQIDSSTNKVIVDLRETDYMDSSALGMLLNMKKTFSFQAIGLIGMMNSAIKPFLSDSNPRILRLVRTAVEFYSAVVHGLARTNCDKNTRDPIHTKTMSDRSNYDLFNGLSSAPFNESCTPFDVGKCDTLAGRMFNESYLHHHGHRAVQLCRSGGHTVCSENV